MDESSSLRVVPLFETLEVSRWLMARVLLRYMEWKIGPVSRPPLPRGGALLVCVPPR
jgi:hypothetical protein